MTEPRHAPQIRLCKPCEHALQKIAERGDAAGTAWYCEHTGALAVVIIRDRTIISWTLEGPLAEQDAKSIIQDGLADGVLRWQAEQGQRH